MSTISIDSLEFYFDSPLEKLFDNVTISLDTSWKLGIVGRNGYGKTTLLNLLLGKLSPVSGSISLDVNLSYFPYQPINSNEYVINTIKDAVAPFREWERQMKNLLARSDEESLSEYGEILTVYSDAGGYEIDFTIEKEMAGIGLDASMLRRRFNTLSGGEQTRVLLIPMFLRGNTFPLIDEPTNHLDIEGRDKLASYLSNKDGYIIVSHDRSFLDRCADHILSINKSDVRINKGNYSSWKYNIDIQEDFEKRKNEKLKREIKQLEDSARKKRTWSDSKEKEKRGAADKGFIGHRAAKMMQRALNIEKRVNDNLVEKKELLKNYEKERSLKLETHSGSHENLLSLYNVDKSYNGKPVIRNFSITLNRGDRIALTGKNGSGKTTLLKIITGEVQPDSGSVHIPKRLNIAFVRQIPSWTEGYLRDRLHENNIDETIFRNILGSFGSGGEIFERPLETFSRGELKKIELTRTFITPVDLLIWDEPMNYIDIASRESIEKTILNYSPTLLFVDHDLSFIQNVATRRIILGNS